jgi:hypothetical protein
VESRVGSADYKFAMVRDDGYQVAGLKIALAGGGTNRLVESTVENLDGTRFRELFTLQG